MTPERSPLDAVVIGGGVMGLAVLEALSRSGARALLLEQFDLEHVEGSSHGSARIARSTYHDPLYARWMREALAEDWPRLERDAGVRLLHPGPGCVFGPADGEIADYERACREAGAPVRRVDGEEACRLFSGLREEVLRDPGTVVLHDESAAVVAARETRHALLRLARSRGATVRERTTCLGWKDEPGGALRVLFEGGSVVAERLVVCAGSWVARLVPSLAGTVTVLPQSVGYFELDAPEADTACGRFPIWIRLGRAANDVVYGLPRFETRGVKIARHITVREGATPGASPDDELEAADLRALLAGIVAAPVRALERLERCRYTMTPTSDFVLGPLAEDPRVTIGAGFSGHGFKFAPLVGRLLADRSAAIPARLRPAPQASSR